MNEQSDQKYQALAQAGLEEAASAGESPSVLLDVPTLKVDEISLELEELEANILGVNASIGRVKLDIKGLESQAVVTVRLHTIAAILSRVVTANNSSPDVLKTLLQQTASGGQNGRQRQSGNGRQEQQASGDSSQRQGRDGEGGGARHIIEEVAGEGCTIRRSIDSFGDILEQVLDNDGKVVEEVIVGSVSDLCIVKERTSEGETVRRVRDGRTSMPNH